MINQPNNQVSMMIERRPVVGYEGLYEVSEDGHVYRVASRMNAFPGHKLKHRQHKLGYLGLVLCKDGKMKSHTVHRLVANAFLPNPDGFPQVNHKNGDKSDNRAENLEWCNNSYNHYHACNILGIETTKKKRPVRGTHLISGVIIWMPSMSEAARFINGSEGAISVVCQGKLKQTKGWHFQYI